MVLGTGCAVRGTEIGHVSTACCAMRGTESGYAATSRRCYCLRSPSYEEQTTWVKLLQVPAFACKPIGTSRLRLVPVCSYWYHYGAKATGMVLQVPAFASLRAVRY